MARARVLISATAILAAVTPSWAQDLNVFAAASLKEAATDVAKSFERSHPGVHVLLNFAGSQQLAAQINQGAPCDLFLSAGMTPLNGLTYDRTSLKIFATNRLTIVVPASSTTIRTARDLARAQRLVIADKSVPVGDYTIRMLAKADKVFGVKWVSQVQARIVSKEQDVRAVLTKVSLGEADAGIVYTSDVAAAKGKLRAIPIPTNLNVEARYPAVTFAGSSEATLGRAFLRFILESQSQRAFLKRGFGSPPASKNGRGN